MAVDVHFKDEEIQITISVLLRCFKSKYYDLSVIMKVNNHCYNSAIGHILNI